MDLGAPQLSQAIDEDDALHGLGGGRRVAVQPAYSRSAQRRVGVAVNHPHAATDLAPFLSPHGVRLLRAGGHAEVRLWPIPRDKRNRERYDGLGAGDTVLFCVEDTIVARARVIGVDPDTWVRQLLGETGSHHPGPALLLSDHRRLQVPYSVLWDVVSRGPSTGPPRLMLLDEDETIRALAAIEPFESGTSDEFQDGTVDIRGTPAPEVEKGPGGQGGPDAGHPTQGPGTNFAGPAGQLGEGPAPGASYEDEMDVWRRQGLAAHLHAIRLASELAGSGLDDAVRSLRRLTANLANQIGETSPHLAARARALSMAPEEKLQAGTLELGRALQQEAARPQPEPVRILIVEDDPVAAKLAEAMMQGPNRDLLLAGTKEEADRLLADHTISLLLLDQSLPDADGRDLLVEFRSNPATAGIPVIVLSTASGAHAQAEAFALGADAYFEKPANPATLAAATSAFLLRSAQLRDQAVRDRLTGLKTRAVFLDALESVRASIDRKGIPLAVATIEIDRLRAINDFHGHAAGDAVLKWMAHALTSVLRRSDLVARWGDAQFAIALGGADVEGARRALDGVRAALQTTEGRNEAIAHLEIGCSAGITEVEPGMDLDEALLVAERRMVQAGRGAGGRTVFSEDPVVQEDITILVVEDDRLTGDLIRHRLSREGYTVVLFEDGLEALEATPAMSTSLVILDVAMPGADGFGILQRLRRTPSFADVPVMMLTQERQIQVERAFSLGATDILKKPFALSELVARVGRLLAEA